MALFSASCGGQTLVGGRGGTGGTISGSGGITGTGGKSSGTGGGGPIDCGAVEDLPPVLTVVDVSNDYPICDPTFTVVEDASTPTDANAQRCGTTTFGCPQLPATDGPPPCIFVLYGLTNAKSYTVAVGAPGYLTSQIADVSHGQAAICGNPYEAPSQLTVKLSPVLFDAGAVVHP